MQSFPKTQFTTNTMDKHEMSACHSSFNIALLIAVIFTLSKASPMPQYIDLNEQHTHSYNLSCSPKMPSNNTVITQCCWLVYGHIGSRISIAFINTSFDTSIEIEELSMWPPMCSFASCGRDTAVWCNEAQDIRHVIVGDMISIRLNPTEETQRMVTVTLLNETSKCPTKCHCLINAAGAVNVTCKGWSLETIAKVPNSTIELKMKYSDEPTLPNGTFSHLTKLIILDLGKNNLSSVDSNAFAGLSSIEKIKLHKNRLLRFDPEHCSGFPRKLKSLRLDGNKITRLHPNVFKDCSDLVALKLSRNNITKLENGTFNGLNKLLSVTLENNQISTIEQGALDGLYNLQYLDISQNNLSTIEAFNFKNLSRLQILELRFNPWRSIEPFAFSGLANLTIMFLQRTPKYWSGSRMYLNSFEGLNSLGVLNVDDHRICCLLPNQSTLCNKQTKPPLFDSCEQYLLPSYPEKAFLWIFSICAIVGNTYVIIIRCRGKHARNQSQSILILNLAMSDLLMGFYMMIIAGADVAYGQEFVLFAEEWTSSWLCKFAGLVSFFSSEASVLFVVLISVDRLLCIALPYGKKRMSAEVARNSSIFVWVTVSLLGGTAIVLQETTNTYGLASVCVGLPLVSSKTYLETTYTQDHDIQGADDEGLRLETYKTQDSGSKWQFSIAIYLGLNLIAFFIVLACYLAIGIIVSIKLPNKNLQRKKDRKREMKMAARMALIVLTDFCCWMPVIILGILVQSHTIPDTRIRNNYSWVVALVLPLNAALNPYLYTLATGARQQTKLKQGERNALNTRMPTCSNSQTRTKVTAF